MTVYHIPKAILERHHPLPEFAPVEPVEDSFALPQPGISEPIRAALDRQATEDICTGCGVPTRLHQTFSGTWIGCAGAMRQQTPPRNPERWDDPWPNVTCAVRKALLMDCGPDMEIHTAGYTHDELLAVASAIAKAAIKEYRASQGAK